MSHPTDTPDHPPRAKGSPLLAAVLTLALVAAAGFLLARTVIGAKASYPLNPPEALAPIPDAEEHERRLNVTAGVYRTGSEPGDRVITIERNGNVRFSVLGPQETFLAVSDQYTLGLRDRRLCLATTRSGTIEIIDVDRLSFWDDQYERFDPDQPDLSPGSRPHSARRRTAVPAS